MTFLAGTMSILMALLLAAASLFQASRAAMRVRAQTAADASALAAVAESTPLGDGLHLYEARRFAEANGAKLLSCLCYPGATAVQVDVVVDGVQARARATYDPNLLMPAASAAGLVPTLARAVDVLVAASGGRIHVVSGGRSTEEQRRLWTQALVRYGNAEVADDWVAPPGGSMHQRGTAVDLGGDLDLAARLVVDLGLPLHRPLSHEPWHFELVGSDDSNAV